MVRTETGMLVRSLAGHEKDRLYIIIRQDEEYVWLVDGRNRTMEKPKKKKKKHTTTQPQVVYYTSQGRDVIVQHTESTTKQPTPKVPKAQQNSVPLDAIGEIIH